MRRGRFLAVVLLVSLLSVAGFTAGSASAGVRFNINLTGDQVPGGDQDGLGRALLDITPKSDLVCFRILVRDIQLPSIAAHIHQAPPGEDGPVVVTLAGPDTSASSRGCNSGFAPGVLEDIVANPAGYYVNVHNMEFPGGALRGQLG